MPIANNRKSDKLHPSIPTGLILMAWAVLMLAWPSEQYARKSYSEFIQQVEAGDVQFLGGYRPRRPLSPQVEATIDRGIKNLIDHAHHAAQEILAHNEQLLRQMAGILQEQEILEGQELHAYLQQVQKPPLLDKWLLTGELEINYPIDAQFPVMSNSHNQSIYEYSYS